MGQRDRRCSGLRISFVRLPSTRYLPLCGRNSSPSYWYVTLPLCGRGSAGKVIRRGGGVQKGERTGGKYEKRTENGEGRGKRKGGERKEVSEFFFVDCKLTNEYRSHPFSYSISPDRQLKSLHLRESSA